MSSETKTNIIISPAPHFHTKINPDKIMIRVIIGLVPAMIASAYFFGIVNFLRVVGISTLSAILFQYIILKIFKRKPIAGAYTSGVVTGILLGLTLPPTVPWWIPLVGSGIAIIIAKEFFGGLGQNPFNPALIGRAVLGVSWPVHLTKFVTPFEGISTATPLALLKDGIDQLPKYWDLLIGNVSGSIGETSALLLLIGGFFLLFTKTIDWQIPFSYLGSMMVLSLAMGRDPIFEILAGGVMLGAFFMATDYVTSPVTSKGRIIFGIGCGVFTFAIRVFGGYPEGVTFAILIMNAFSPIIEKSTLPIKFGEVKK